MTSPLPANLSLESLDAATPAPGEIIVVADGESDGSWRLAEEFGATILHMRTPSGPALARNRGANAAQGEILFFVDADVAVAPDAIGQVADAFRERPELAAVFGSYDDEPAVGNFLSQYKNLMHHYVHQTAREDASTFWSGCGAVRRPIFQEMNGFSTDYSRPCIEDIELGYRMKQAGYQIGVRKTLLGKHLKQWTAISLIRTDFFQRAVPWTQLILNNSQMTNDLNLDTSSRASVALTYALIAALVASFFLPQLLLAALLIGAILIALNTHVYSFFIRKRGLRFSVQVIPWHWFYYFYSGLAFGIGLCIFYSRRWMTALPNFMSAD